MCMSVIQGTGLQGDRQSLVRFNEEWKRKKVRIETFFLLNFFLLSTHVFSCKIAFNFLNAVCSLA